MVALYCRSHREKMARKPWCHSNQDDYQDHQTSKIYGTCKQIYSEEGIVYDQATAEAETFKGLASAQRKRLQLAEREIDRLIAKVISH